MRWSSCTRSSSRCPAARCSTTATRSRWATTCSSATATACARRCSGPATATAGSRAPTSPRSTRRRGWLPSTASRPSTSGRSCARRRRSCAGSSASSPCARSIRSSGSAPTSRSRRTTRRSSPTSAVTRTTWRSASTTSAARPRPCSSICQPTRGGRPRRCSGARASRASASSPTSSPSPRGASSGSCSGRTPTPTWSPAMATPDLTTLDEETLSSWLLGRRWFGSKAEEVAHVGVLDSMGLDTADPALLLALLEARFPTGTHHVYQLLFGVRPQDEGWTEGRIEDVGGATVYDAFADPEAYRRLGRMLAAQATVRGDTATVNFYWIEGVEPPGEDAQVRAMGAEQSNSSVVFDDAYVLKAFRRLEAGDNPELEMLRFLTEREFPNIAELVGWIDYEGDLMDATLGVAQRFVSGGRDGWELALDELASDPEAFVGRMEDLGAVIGRMHTALASDPNDPAFAPEEPSMESTSLITATIDEQIERLFVDLPSDTPALEPIVHRGEEVRDRLSLLSHIGSGGKLIRHHGDLHLGQTLLAPDRWIVLDFEGEPARPLLERRRKRSPLRDVAGMLRSFAYAASAAELQRGATAPEGWEDRTREAFLAGYFGAVDPGLLPPGEANARTLLTIFELEKAVYELRYELNNRPDWVRIPVAGIARLLEEPLP